jgi:hypothetical protein
MSVSVSYDDRILQLRSQQPPTAGSSSKTTYSPNMEVWRPWVMAHWGSRLFHSVCDLGAWTPVEGSSSSTSRGNLLTYLMFCSPVPLNTSRAFTGYTKRCSRYGARLPCLLYSVEHDTSTRIPASVLLSSLGAIPSLYTFHCNMLSNIHLSSVS